MFLSLFKAWTRRWTNFSSYHKNNLVFIIIIYHHLCHLRKRGWVPLHHRYYTCLYSPVKYMHLYILIYFQDIDTVAVYKYAYKWAYTRGDLAQHLEQKNQTSIQVFILSIQNPAAIIIRTRDIRTDNQTPVTYACLIFGMLVYSYLRSLGVRHRDLVTVPSFNRDLPMHL